jgi:hypothetical protein
MPAAEPVAARPLVLVVNDAHALRLVMSRTLIDGGYDVLAAPDGQSATVLLTGLRAPPTWLSPIYECRRWAGCSWQLGWPSTIRSCR